LAGVGKRAHQEDPIDLFLRMPKVGLAMMQQPVQPGSLFMGKLLGWLVTCRLVPVYKHEDQVYQFKVSQLNCQLNCSYVVSLSLSVDKPKLRVAINIYLFNYLFNYSKDVLLLENFNTNFIAQWVRKLDHII